MTYLNEQILRSLRESRKRKKLSQRALSTSCDIPQSHISKIENGDVDLRLSSLIALARVLDLELMLVPKHKLPAIQTIIRGAYSTIEDTQILPAYSLDNLDDDTDE